MHTDHRLHVGDARAMQAVDDESVELVVTSPPYPMIDLWDDTFCALDSRVEDALDAADPNRAFRLMHAVLDAVWDELARVVIPGGLVCVNVGDATRSFADGFRRFPNCARVTSALRARDFRSLPGVRWRKPTNRRTKFMGSGTLPPNAYVSLETEHVLVFRKGERRTFPPAGERRYESAYFWEERNDWFSDLWELAGTDQSLDDEQTRQQSGDTRTSTQQSDVTPVTEAARERSGAFPLSIPRRLIRMYSVYGDTVLDPFAGTGTTLAAALEAGRDSVGYEIDERLTDTVVDRLLALDDSPSTFARQRLADHRSFVADADRDLPYESVHYDFPVTTKQEREIRLYGVESVEQVGDGADVPGPTVPTDDGIRSLRAMHAPVAE